MFGWNSAENFANQVDRLECARSLPNWLMVIDRIENISPEGSLFTVSNKEYYKIFAYRTVKKGSQ
jgi:hypothetical protein